MDKSQKRLQVKEARHSNYMKFLENIKLQRQKADQWMLGLAVKSGKWRLTTNRN